MGASGPDGAAGHAGSIRLPASHSGPRVAGSYYSDSHTAGHRLDVAGLETAMYRGLCLVIAALARHAAVGSSGPWPPERASTSRLPTLDDVKGMSEPGLDIDRGSSSRTRPQAPRMGF